MQRAAIALVLLHAHARVPAAGYAGVFLACMASWGGLSGIGEAALIAAGIAASSGHLALAPLLAIAWVGAMVGGVGGWLLGLKGGRALLGGPGPLRALRMDLISFGDRLYDRFGFAAVLLAPTWVAGVHGMSATRFLAANAIAALVWAVAIGAGAYAAGPAIAGALDEERLVAALMVAVVAAVILAMVVWRRRSRHGGN
jgi:membrane-associated protein